MTVQRHGFLKRGMDQAGTRSSQSPKSLPGQVVRRRPSLTLKPRQKSFASMSLKLEAAATETNGRSSANSRCMVVPTPPLLPLLRLPTRPLMHPRTLPLTHRPTALLTLPLMCLPMHPPTPLLLPLQTRPQTFPLTPPQIPRQAGVYRKKHRPALRGALTTV